MNREKEEETIPVTIDKVEFIPNTIFGLCGSEFFTVVGGALFFSSLFTLPLSGFLFGAIWYGPVMSLAISLCTGLWFAKKAVVLKRNRPSYLLWSEWKRKIQNAGYFNFGLVKHSVWENKATRNKKK